MTFAGRFLERTDDGEPTPTLAVCAAQYDAGLEGASRHAASQRLTGSNVRH